MPRLEALPRVQGHAQRHCAAGLERHGLQEGHVLKHHRQAAGRAAQLLGEHLPGGGEEGGRLRSACMLQGLGVSQGQGEH